MILIAGRPFDAAPIMNDYPRGSVEQQLLSIMSQSSQTYDFDSLSQLKFELWMRDETVNSAKALYNSGLGFSVFHKSKCSPVYWDRMPNGGFRLREGADTARAIEDIFINGSEYATECATAMMIVYYKALLSIFKQNAFNKLFPTLILMNWHAIDPLLKEVGKPRKVEDFLFGDRGYFKNPDVDPKTPEWQGENVIVLPDALYYGHGIGISTYEDIINALNSNRKKGASQSAYFLDTASHPDFKKLAGVYERFGQTASLVWSAFPPAISTAKAAF